ncbi:DinB family protein [Cohnella suwonensis]|uniref:DinB family protein n=1 Tax=Cohnella suwonensis TaxID=696072 RepID=A0ABW0LNI7_9BACL
MFKQLEFARSQTLKQLEGVAEDDADRVPQLFRNSIRWNAGHIYVVTERFAFQYIGLSLQLPEGFKERFERDTSPLTVSPDVPGSVPTLRELESLLKDQPARIAAALGARLNEPLALPFTTSAGLLLETPAQCLSFNLYHEGMHVNAIKNYKRLLLS